MRVLLDTHSLLWFVAADAHLSVTARRVIEASENDKIASVASIWEIAIKTSPGKLEINVPIDEFMSSNVYDYAFAVLNVTDIHAIEVAKLPLHHRDPFDRLLVAQTIVERVSIVSVDAAFDAYAVSRIW